MTRDDAEQFAQQWIANWNRKDVAAIIAHFAERATFTSPKAARVVGHATVTGRDAIERYWRTSAAAIRTIRFGLDHIVWDEPRQELVVVYVSTINGMTARACEIMRFGADGLQCEGEALYGVAP